MTVLAAVLAVAAPGVAQGPDTDMASLVRAAYGPPEGCVHWYSPRQSIRGVNANLLNHNPTVKKARVRYWIRCSRQRPPVRAARRAAWRWRHSYAHRWPIVLNRQPAYWRSWAWNTSGCEGGHNPSIHNSTGIYHGTFQFLLSTWHAAGGTGDPHQHSYAYQAVIAIGLARREGTQHWPRCG